PQALLLGFALAPFGLFALMAALRIRPFFLVAWVGLITIADFRAYAQLISVPAALGAGYAVGALGGWLQRRAGVRAASFPNESVVAESPSQPRVPPRITLPKLAAALALFVVIWSFYMNFAFVGVA